MKKVRLSRRLRAVAALLPPTACYADIGADRGELAYHLLTSGHVQRAILCDISAACLERARTLFAGTPYRDRVDLRLGDGLTTLAPGEATYLVMAGMGGRTICQMMGGSPDVLPTLHGLVIQAMTDLAAVRRRLQALGFAIAAETLLWEEGHYYTVIFARPGQMELDAMAQAVGPAFCASQKPLLPTMIRGETEERRRLLPSLPLTGRGAERRAQLQAEIAFWEEIADAYLGANHQPD